MAVRWPWLWHVARKHLAGILAGVATVLLVTFGLLDGLEYWSLAQLFERRGARTAAAPIVIVTIDESTFSELDMQWPFPRAVHGELLTRITIPPAEGDGFASVTIGREGTCIVNVAATRMNGETRVAIGCVAAVPVLGMDGLDPPSDVHGSADYRRHLAKVLADRAIAEAGG